MISGKALGYLRKTFGDQEYELRLQDITDRQLKAALDGMSTTNFENVIGRLVRSVEDPEIKAHLLGWESAEHRRREIKEFEEMQRKLSKWI